MQVKSCDGCGLSKLSIINHTTTTTTTSNNNTNNNIIIMFIAVAVVIIITIIIIISSSSSSSSSISDNLFLESDKSWDVMTEVRAGQRRAVQGRAAQGSAGQRRAGHCLTSLHLVFKLLLIPLGVSTLLCSIAPISYNIVLYSMLL